MPHATTRHSGTLQDGDTAWRGAARPTRRAVAGASDCPPTCAPTARYTSRPPPLGHSRANIVAAIDAAGLTAVVSAPDIVSTRLDDGAPHRLDAPLRARLSEREMADIGALVHAGDPTALAVSDAF